MPSVLDFPCLYVFLVFSGLLECHLYCHLHNSPRPNDICVAKLASRDCTN